MPRAPPSGAGRTASHGSPGRRAIHGVDTTGLGVFAAHALAFLPDADPLAPGHTLVAPRTHCVGILDAPPGVLAATMDLVQRVGLAMTTGVGATGIVVLSASGPYSGQSVPHLHFHVVPCWPDDNATYWPTDQSAHVVAGPVHRILAASLKRIG